MLKFKIIFFSMLIIYLNAWANSYVFAENKDESEEIYDIGEISVTPGKFSIDESTPSTYLIPKSQMEKLPLIDNDIYRAAHSLPGVVSDDFSARFSIRGGERDEILVRLDGMELYEPYHLQDFGGAISVIDLGIVKHADLFTGGFPAEFGDFMSGVFDVITGEGKREKVSGDIGIDLVNAHTILEIPFSKTSWLISARRGYIDMLMGLMESDEVFKPRYYDLYSKLIHNVSSQDKLSIHILHAGDTNEIDQTGEENDIQSKYWNSLLWTKWNHRMGESIFWNTYLFYGQSGRRKYEGIDGTDERSMSYIGLKGDIKYDLTESQSVKLGLRWQIGTADYNYFFREEQIENYVKTKADGWEANFYVQDEWLMNKYLAWNIGLRYFYQSYGDTHSIMPRLALAIVPKKELTIRTAWGIYDQPVKITNLPVEEGISSAQSPERSIHYILSAEYLPKPNLFIKSEAYYKIFDNLVGQIKDYGRKEQFFIPIKSGSANGIEFFIRHAPIAKFSWGVGYGIAKSSAEISAGTIPRNADRRHSLNLSANYALWTDGGINVSWRYHSGEPYTDAWYEKELSIDNNSYEWKKKYGKINGKRYPSYHSLDMRLTKNFQLKSWYVSLYFQIMNLYNRKNVHEYSFEQMIDENGEIYYQKVTEHFLPIIPTLGMSVKF